VVVPVIAHLLDGWAFVTHVTPKILLLVLLRAMAPPDLSSMNSRRCPVPRPHGRYGGQDRVTRICPANPLTMHWGVLVAVRGIATRYDKYALTFLGGVLLAAMITHDRIQN
jgi:hypothetical protein